MNDLQALPFPVLLYTVTLFLSPLSTLISRRNKLKLLNLALGEKKKKKGILDIQFPSPFTYRLHQNLFLCLLACLQGSLTYTSRGASPSTKVTTSFSVSSESGRKCIQSGKKLCPRSSELQVSSDSSASCDVKRK